MNELEKLAKFVHDFDYDTLPELEKAMTIQHVWDTVGVSLGAKDNTMFKKIKDVFLNAEDAKHGNSDKMFTIWGSEDKAFLRTATFINAMSCHVLELDDVHTNSKTHIGTVVIPSAWVLAEHLNKTGKDFLAAVVCGYEVMSRIGMGFGVSSHRNKGWHVTCTAGTFGAAAACAKLLNFSTEEIVAAFGMAGTQSCATWAFLSDGATNKILHPARAAASGLESCLLVLGGMRGSKNILDAEDGGIFPMMSDEYDYTLVSKDLGTVYELLNVDNKPYPACRSTHGSIDAAIALKNEHAISPEEIASINVNTYLVGYKQCGLTDSSKEPHLPPQAKFSTPYNVACALINGNVTLSDFDEKNIDEPKRQQLLKLIKVTPDDKFTKKYPHHWGCELQIHLKNGIMYSKEVEDASGSVDSPLTEEQIINKIHGCCQMYDLSWIDNLYIQIKNLESASKLPSLNPSH